MPVRNTFGVPGSPIFGGQIVTAGGLVFLSGTMDAMFRAFDIETGEVLRETELPAAAIARRVGTGRSGSRAAITCSRSGSHEHGKANGRVALIPVPGREIERFVIGPLHLQVVCVAFDIDFHRREFNSKQAKECVRQD